MLEKLRSKLVEYENQIDEYEEMFGEGLVDIDPMDASGGNFDDAYQLGCEHGETFGKYELLLELINELED